MSPLRSTWRTTTRAMWFLALGGCDELGPGTPGIDLTLSRSSLDVAQGSTAK